MERNTVIAKIAKMVVPVALMGALVGAAAVPSMAQDKMSVNARLHRQDARIHEGVHAHDLSKYQAHALHVRDRSIHHAEIVDRRHDHGHLTPAEHTRLEHRLNDTNRAIYDRKHDIR